jgi:alpha-L-rhamnosidase
LKNKIIITAAVLTLFYSVTLWAQLPPVFNDNDYPALRTSALSRKSFSPVRIVWVSDETGKEVKNKDAILKPGNGQADLNRGEYLTLVNEGNNQAGILLDFGKQIQGELRL